MLGTWRIRKLCCGWHARWLQLLSRVAQCSGMPLQEGFEGIAQIAGQVPAIRNLDRTRRTLLRALGKGIRAITRDDRHAGVFLEAGGKLLGDVIRQQIEHLMALKIDHNRAVVPSFALGPLVDPNDLGRCNGWWWHLS